MMMNWVQVMGRFNFIYFHMLQSVVLQRRCKCWTELFDLVRNPDGLVALLYALQELSVLLPSVVLDIHMVGPNLSSLVDGQVLTLRPSLTLTLHHGLYHAVQSQLSAPDIIIGKCLMHLSPLILPTKVREYVFTGIGLCVCVWVCVSVCYHDNYKDCGRICTKFYGKVPRGKGKTKFVFRYDR